MEDPVTPYQSLPNEFPLYSQYIGVGSLEQFVIFHQTKLLDFQTTMALSGVILECVESNLAGSLMAEWLDTGISVT